MVTHSCTPLTTVRISKPAPASPWLTCRLKHATGVEKLIFPHNEHIGCPDQLTILHLSPDIKGVGNPSRLQECSDFINNICSFCPPHTHLIYADSMHPVTLEALATAWRTQQTKNLSSTSPSTYIEVFPISLLNFEMPIYQYTLKFLQLGIYLYSSLGSLAKTHTLIIHG